MDPSSYSDKTSPSAFYNAMGNPVCYPIHFNTLLYNPMNSYSFMPHPFPLLPPHGMLPGMQQTQQTQDSHLLSTDKSAETLSNLSKYMSSMNKFYLPPNRRPISKYCLASPAMLEDNNIGRPGYGVAGSGDTDSGLAGESTSPVSGGCSEKECYVSSPGTEMEEPDSSGKCSTDVVEQKVIIPRWTCDSSQPPVCPLCSRTMLPTEMTEHFNCEVEKLDELMRKKDWLSQDDSNPDQSILRHPHFHDTEKKCPEYRKETYLRVRNNRISRLGGCNSRTKRPYFDEHNKNPWKIHRPNQLCSPKQEHLSDESSTQSGHQSMLMLELTVQQLAHRTESRTEPGSENISPENRNLSHYQRSSQPSVEGFDDQNKADIADSSCNGFNNLESGVSCFPESLQRQHGENRTDENPCSSVEIKCHVCSESYKKPVVSVCCWHVHCETCWLKALGSKRVCPKCDTITSPNDLRKIHL